MNYRGDGGMRKGGGDRGMGGIGGGRLGGMGGGALKSDLFPRCQH
jgi:hypothetical protein